MRLDTVRSLLLSSLVVGCATQAARPPEELTTVPDQSPAQPSDPSVQAAPAAPAWGTPAWYDELYGGCARLASANMTPTALEALVQRADAGTAAAEPSQAELRELGLRVLRTKEQVRVVIQAGIEPMRQCYEQALVVWPRVEGRVLVTFMIAADGGVLSAVVRENQTNVEQLGCCVATRVRDLRFSAPDDGRVVKVTYPFTFKPGTGLMDEDG